MNKKQHENVTPLLLLAGWQPESGPIWTPHRRIHTAALFNTANGVPISKTFYEQFRQSSSLHFLSSLGTRLLVRLFMTHCSISRVLTRARYTDSWHQWHLCIIKLARPVARRACCRVFALQYSKPHRADAVHLIACRHALACIGYLHRKYPNGFYARQRAQSVCGKSRSSTCINGLNYWAACDVRSVWQPVQS